MLAEFGHRAGPHQVLVTPSSGLSFPQLRGPLLATLVFFKACLPMFFSCSGISWRDSKSPSQAFRAPTYVPLPFQRRTVLTRCPLNSLYDLLLSLCFTAIFLIQESLCCSSCPSKSTSLSQVSALPSRKSTHL